MRTPLIIGAAVLALLVTAGCDGQPAASPPTDTLGTTPALPTPPPTTTTDAGPTTTTGAGPATTQPPTGPQIVYFRVASKPSCPAGTNVNPIAGNPVRLEWKITGADSAELAVDGPGLYGAYSTEEDKVTISFPCGGAPGTTQSHTYTLTTVGGGPKRTRTLTVKAQVNEIGQV